MNKPGAFTAIVLLLAVGACSPAPGSPGATVPAAGSATGDGLAQIFPHQAPLQSVPESGPITLRNVTPTEVTYTIEAPVSARGEKRLAPDGVERFPDSAEMLVRYLSGKERRERKLQPTKHYAFRFNHKGLLRLYPGSHGRADTQDLAPYVPTPMAVVERMLELADVQDTDVVYDIGCGDGRIVITAAKRYGARGVGLDFDPVRVAEAKGNAKATGTEDRVEFRVEDATKADLSQATVVTLYLLPESNELMRPRLEAQLKPGTRVVTHAYRMPGWRDKLVESDSVHPPGDDKKHSVYLYAR